ncbi:glycosyltransferase family 2 protein [Streptacidiphilus monticola]|uniref:Glycosyltransferase family 2 protein n=1 Tax=Streptacidiphilus monticola TaxID=2161674 RepID=A0ABW1FYN7_9ACTN
MKLSVVVPCYRVAAFAPTMLRSLDRNAADGIEFLLVDDCSTDSTPDLLHAWARGRRDARVLRTPENSGLSAARNLGLDAAEGRWIMFFDGDDWLGPGYLPQLLAVAERHDADFVRTDHVQVTAIKRVVHRAPQARRNVVLDPRDGILPANTRTMVDYPYAWAGVAHSRLRDRGLLHFDPELRTAEDRPWIWRLHLNADSYVVAGLHGLFYRRAVSNSLTQIGDARQLAFLRAFDDVLAQVAADRDAEAMLPKAVRTYVAIIAHHLSRQDRLLPEVAAELRAGAADALARMPQDHLERVLGEIDDDRARAVRRLRRRTPVAA